MSCASTGMRPWRRIPLDTKTIYFGSQYLHKSTNKGVTWEIISPDLTTNDSVKIDQATTAAYRYRYNRR